MATTTLKLPEDLKRRIVAAAAEAGKTPHAFMLDALAAQTALAERRRQFVESARLADQQVAETGLVYDADAVVSYLQDTLAGKPARRPRKTRL